MPLCVGMHRMLCRENTGPRFAQLRCYTFNSVSTATYYDLLKVDRKAAPEGVRAAYRSLAQRYHPDKRPGNADAIRVMAALNEAYAVLSDPQKRARYDRSIDGARLRSESARRSAQQPVREAMWPWWLLFATFAFAVLSIGVVAYRMVFPAVSIPAVQSASRQPAPAAPLKLTTRRQ
jgi:curved DNA-binding protein CbpA